jgi:FSR family fosmidomycin resistance protein-like MFS transporter
MEGNGARSGGVFLSAAEEMKVPVPAADAAAGERPASTAAAVLPETSGGAGRRLLLLSCGHFFVDLYSSALGALQPLLVARHGLSLLQAGTLGGVLSFSSSLMQPLYGYLSDRMHFRGFTVLAPFIAGIFISSLGLAGGYGTLLALVFLAGVGIAAFHPQGTAQAAATYPYRRGLTMAIFITSGTIGLSMGPTYFSLMIGWLGLERAYWAAVPGLFVTLVLAFTLTTPADTRRSARVPFDLVPLRRVWKPMTLLYFLVVIRSIIQISFAQFLPLYLHLERGYPTSQASYVLTLFLLGGALGGFVGGNLADRFGGKRIVIFSMIGSVPFLVLFQATTGWVSLTAMCLGGIIALFTIPVNVTMAQELVPRSQAGTVSALMMGFAWGMAGIFGIPLLGWVADHIGLTGAFWAVVLSPLIGFFLAVKLPNDPRPGSRGGEWRPEG